MRSLNEKDLIQSLGVGEKQQMEAAPVSENQNKWKSRETPLTVLWCMRRHHHHTKSQRVLIYLLYCSSLSASFILKDLQIKHKHTK